MILPTNKLLKISNLTTKLKICSKKIVSKDNHFMYNNFVGEIYDSS